MVDDKLYLGSASNLCHQVRDRGQSPASSWLAGDYAVDRVFTTPLPRVHHNAELIVAADRRIGTPEAALPTKGNRSQGASLTGRANPRNLANTKGSKR